jgi:hypothetical protein
MNQNKSIKELAEQAKQSALDAMIKITDKEQALKVYSESYDIKFAQLIGQQCLMLADNIRDECDQDDEPQQALGAAWVAIAIARHFGLDK